VLGGDLWLEFLARCRAVVGSEGGASVLDRDGSIKARVERYLEDHPGADFREVERACFPGEDGRIDKACITPRHLEACAAETLQILVEGRYNDILIPGRHYVAVSKDYSDAGPALAVLDDPARVREMTKAAYEDIVASGRWSYPNFVTGIERDIFDRDAPAPRAWTPRRWLAFYGIAWRDRLCWLFIRLEKWYYHRGRHILPVRALVAVARRLRRGLARLRAAGSPS
jgi:hypothetical protein